MASTNIRYAESPPFNVTTCAPRRPSTTRASTWCVGIARSDSSAALSRASSSFWLPSRETREGLRGRAPTPSADAFRRDRIRFRSGTFVDCQNSGRRLKVQSYQSPFRFRQIADYLFHRSWKFPYQCGDRHDLIAFRELRFFE